MEEEKFKIYGASDDLVEIRGSIEDEIGCYFDSPHGIKFECSDGTRGSITYLGEWEISIEVKGESFLKLVKSVGDDKDHVDEDCKDLPSYSDVLVLSKIDWIQIGENIYERKI